jgi:DNA-binding transcriptional regulator LsrR (DeoR family)
MSQKSNSAEKEELTPKEKRIKEAVVMHYGKDMQVQEVAEEMGYNRKTIQRYLDSDFASNLKRVYSDQEIYDLKAQLETEIRDSKKLAENLISRAIQHEDATPRDLIKASQAIQNLRQRHINMLQEIGIEINDMEDKEASEPSEVIINEEVVDKTSVETE